MSRKISIILLILLVLLIPLIALSVLGNMVSLKYEVNEPGDCVSLITGTNLCQAGIILEILLIIDVIISLLLVYKIAFKKNVSSS